MPRGHVLAGASSGAPADTAPDEVPVGAALGPVVRVGLVSNVSRVRVYCYRAWELTAAMRRTTPARVPSAEVLVFEREPGGRIRVRNDGGTEYGLYQGGVVAYPHEAGTIMHLGDRPYRGYFVVLSRPGGLVVVNRLRLDDYVRGVVANEIGRGTRETLEALKAQTVAARTYAYAKMANRSEDAFDVEPTEFDQVYSGVSGESGWVNRAVDETAGEILFYDGEVAEALYSSTCGGHTAGAEEVWGGNGHGHLEGHPDRLHGRDQCAGSKYYTWRAAWDGTTFVSLFGRYYPRVYPGSGRPSGRLRDVRVTARGGSGRVTRLEIVTTDGRFVAERDRIRWVVRRDEPGEPALYSTFFDVELTRRGADVVRVVATGRGYGHGVGMCQTGALSMSRSGRSYREILGHYYRGAELRRPYGGGA